MRTATTKHRQSSPTSPGVAAACELMSTDWSPWHIVLYGLEWEDYEALLAARHEACRKGLRITYDRGTAEIMTPGGGPTRDNRLATTNLNGDPVMSIGSRHERWKKLIARLVEAVALGLRVPLVACGNITLSRADLDRGFEPDECYYVQNARAMKAIREFDFATDPPPDLFIEIEVSRTVQDRLDLCAAMEIPEVWRYDGKRLRILILSDNHYVEASASLAFSILTSKRLNSFLRRAGTIDDTTLCLEVLELARESAKRGS